MSYFFLTDTATTETYTDVHTLSLHDALPIWKAAATGSFYILRCCPTTWKTSPSSWSRHCAMRALSAKITPVRPCVIISISLDRATEADRNGSFLKGRKWK